MADAHRRLINSLVEENDRASTQVGINEVKGAVENGPRLCATGLSTGIVVAVLGIYRDPASPDTPRNDRFLLHAGEGSLEAGMDKLQQALQTARQAGLLELEAHILIPEAFSFTKKRAPSPSGTETSQQGSSAANTLAVNEWDDDDLRSRLATQKSLRERLEQLTRGGPVRWYKYPVCHDSGPYRWTHGMLVSPDETVLCMSLGRSSQGEEMQARDIDPVKDGKEDEDSGLRCC
ncbi:hypothetical protein PG996_007700 [Apiospora saccharicola]|uniref:Uncharacterized protein n=1 Tax=Apiospora saccharicola TaxID=335842 RepID=A0ABR1VBN4_9PEZI